MRNLDFVAWEKLHEENLNVALPDATFRIRYTINPSNILPVFACRVSNWVAGSIFVRLVFGFEDADLDILSPTFLGLGGGGGNGVNTGMLTDPASGKLWPLHTTPPRIGIWINTLGEEIFEGTYSIHVTMETDK